MPATPALTRLLSGIFLLLLALAAGAVEDKYKECPRCQQINEKPSSDEDARYCFRCGADLTGLKYRRKDEKQLLEEGVHEKMRELGEAGKLSAAEWYRRGETAEDLLLKIACFRISLQRGDNPRVHNNLGVLYGRKALHDLAIAEFDAAVRLDDNYANAHANLGRMLTDTGELERAEVHLRRARELAPDRSDVLVNWGNLRVAQGKNGEGAEAFRRVLRLDPQSSAGRIAAFQLQRLEQVGGRKK